MGFCFGCAPLGFLGHVRECPRGGVTPPFLVLRWSSGIPPPAWILLVLLRSRGGEPPPRHPPSLLLQGVVHPPHLRPHPRAAAATPHGSRAAVETVLRTGIEQLLPKHTSGMIGFQLPYERNAAYSHALPLGSTRFREQNKVRPGTRNQTHFIYIYIYIHTYHSSGRKCQHTKSLRKPKRAWGEPERKRTNPWQSKARWRCCQCHVLKQAM